MAYLLKLYGVSALIFLAFDVIWLGVISKNMYPKLIGHLMGDLNVVPAILFYLIYLVGLLFFVVLPGIDRISLGYTLAAGALFGFICYATYDLTNLATLRDWPVKMVLIDLIWGTFVTASTSAIVYLIQAKFF